MHKLIVLYPEPTDRVAFEAYYRETHLPLCAKLPGVQSINFSLGVTPPGDGPYFGVFEASFADEAALSAAMSSPEGRAVEADVPNYATGGATVLTYPAVSYPVGA
ncbi:EthD family reductase [Leucobacter coleopterorum]|uniref:EthD family reductase n=1 Tax=Leucobacter coleopterorum TaxID=2714933 RepID=A0ABX6JX90_9MICO|nr:EthD family reductase [Leucobacter coleopterorum]QIM18926.1 EthD family reductase [Leucobacter coleopterorum]